MTVLDEESGAALVSNSRNGVVWRVNTKTGEYKVVQDDALMRPVPEQIVLAINGLHARDGFLYFTNSLQGIFVRVPIYPDGTAAGTYEIVARVGFCDDLVFDKAGN